MSTEIVTVQQWIHRKIMSIPTRWTCAEQWENIGWASYLDAPPSARNPRKNSHRAFRRTANTRTRLVHRNVVAFALADTQKIEMVTDKTDEWKTSRSPEVRAYSNESGRLIRDYSWQEFFIRIAQYYVRTRP